MQARHALLFLLPLLAAIPVATHPEDTPAIKPLSPGARRWVERTFARLTTDEKIGQIVFPTYFGAFESTESKDFKELMSRVEEDHIGGFILGTRRGPRGIELSHVYETAVLTNELQDAARIPLLIGADFERGTVMRVEEGTAFPHAMAVAAAGRPEDAYTMGRITAVEARAMGVHWVFAPVADVNSNPDNPIINIRSFGEDPKRVAEYVAQFVRGVEENGAMATAKHFPGHGDTSVDSHLELPLVTAGRERLNAVEFVPFEAAIGAGASAVMTAHLEVPALEPNPETPATLSERVLTGVLRDELHFEGLVITDALDMGGVTKGFPPGEVAVRALLAGADVLLMSPVTDAAIAAVRDAVSSGRVPMARLDEAVRRVLEAKARLGLYKQREVDIDKLSGVFHRPEFQAAAEDIADRGVTLLRNDAGLVPLDPRTAKRVFLLAVSADPDTAPAEPFEHELRAQLDSLDALHVDTRYFRVEETHLPPPESYDLAICAVTVRIADRKGTIGLPANEAEMIHALLRAGKPVIMVGLGSPYLMESFPEATTWLAAFSVQDVAQQAAARALLGTFVVSGKLPVSLPGAAPHALHVGDGMTTAAIPMTLQAGPAEAETRLQPVYELLDRLAAESRGVHGALEVVYHGQRFVHRFGGAAPSNEPVPGPEKEIYQPIVPHPFLVTAIARLVQRKELTLDTPVHRILQGVNLTTAREDWRDMPLSRLLEGAGDAHWEWVPPSAASKRGTVAGASNEPPAPESLTLDHVGVEDLIVNRLTGLDDYEAVRQLIFSPLGLAYQPNIRKGYIDLGEETRLRCEELSVLGQLWLNGGIYGHKRLFSRSVMQQFLMPIPQGQEVKTPGWRMSPAPSRLFSSTAYGWEGDGGASLWIDPEYGVSIALVGGNEQLSGPVHDAVFNALGIGKQ